jgi:hypothetical protein
MKTGIQIELTKEQADVINKIPEFETEFPEFLSSYIEDEVSKVKSFIFCPCCGRAKYHKSSKTGYEWRMMDLQDYFEKTDVISEEICDDCNYNSLTTDRILAIKRLKKERLQRSSCMSTPADTGLDKTSSRFF